VTTNAHRSRLLAALGLAALLVPAIALWADSKEEPDPVAELRAGIQEVVADPARASKMLAAVDEIEAAIVELNGLIAVERASLRALLLDHGSSRAAADASLTSSTPGTSPWQGAVSPPTPRSRLRPRRRSGRSCGSSSSR